MSVVISAPHDGYDRNTGRIAELMSSALYGNPDLAVTMKGRKIGKVDINRPGNTEESKQAFEAYMKKVEEVSKKVKSKEGLGALLQGYDDTFLVEIHGKKNTSGKQGYIEIATKGMSKKEEQFIKDLLYEGVKFEKERTFKEEGKRVGWIDEKGVGDAEIVFRASKAKEEGSFSKVGKGIHVELGAKLRVSPHNPDKLTLEGRCVHRALTAAIAVYSGLTPKGKSIQKTFNHLQSYSRK